MEALIKGYAFVNWKVERKSAAIVCGEFCRTHNHVTTRLVSFFPKFPPCDFRSLFGYPPVIACIR